MAADRNASSKMLYPPHSNRVGVGSLLRREIVDVEGRRIGELHDIVFDVASGRISHIFIALNEGKYADQRVMAPWDAISLESGTQRLRFRAAAESTGSERSGPIGRSSRRVVGE